MKLRSILFLTMILLLLASSAFAQRLPDVYIEEELKIESPSQAFSQGFMLKSWVSGRKLKQDNPTANQVMIFRADTGKVYMINPIRRMYQEVPISEIRQMTEQGLAVYIEVKDGKIQIPETLYKKTGKTKKIGKWNCYEMEMLAQQTGPGMDTKTTMWVTKDTGFSHDFLVRIFKISMGDQVSPELQKLFDKMTAVDGYPVQTITVSNVQGQKVISTKTLVKIEQIEDIDSTIFDVPAGFTKVVQPTPPGM